MKFFVHILNSEQNKVKTICTGPELFKKEIQHIRKALTKCKYPKWALDKVEKKFLDHNQEDSNTQGEMTQNSTDSHSGNTTDRMPRIDPVRAI